MESKFIDIVFRFLDQQCVSRKNNLPLATRNSESDGSIQILAYQTQIKKMHRIVMETKETETMLCELKYKCVASLMLICIK